MTLALPRTLALALVTRAPTDRAALHRQRVAALRELLAHAEQHVPFVARRLRAAGVASTDLRSVHGLTAVPVATKRDYQDAGVGEVVARDVSRAALVDRSTSGSTGERMIVKRTWAEERLLNAFRWRALRSCGHRLHHRRAVMRFRLTERPQDEPLAIRLARRSGVLPRRVFDGLAPRADVASVAAFAPHTVSGMTSVVARLADAAVAERLPLRPRLIATGGELMTAPLRARIALLGGEIRDFYGCNELNLVAWQCPAGAATYHVCDDAHVIEVLGADGREVAVGEQGVVVATSLFSWAMPILRYQVGDVAVRGPDGCPCGAVCSTLLAVCGRTIDDFDLGCGNVLHPWEILNVVRPRLGWVRQTQLVQQSRDALVLRVIPLREPEPAEIAQIEALARAALGGRARFALDLVDAITPAPSGKLRPFVPLSAASPVTS
jgi:phenylacetate-CoA ligase